MTVRDGAILIVRDPTTGKEVVCKVETIRLWGYSVETVAGEKFFVHYNDVVKVLHEAGEDE